MEAKDSKNPEVYEAAEHFEITWRHRLHYQLHFLKVQLVVALMFIPEICRGIVNFFITKKPKNIQNQVALVTGGGNGLGRALAFRLAKENCKIAVVDVDFNAAQQTAKELNLKFKVAAEAFRVDVSRLDQIAQLKIDVERTLGHVDILVNNAGLLSMGTSLREGTPEQIQKVIDVNLTSHFWTLRTFLDGMVQRKRGHIVAICSFAGLVTMPGAVAYCATKFGVRGFMEALWDELCLNDQDFVKTTTAFPTFINTRKELADFVSELKHVPRIAPDHAAHMIVKAILLDQRKVYVPAAAKAAIRLNICPDRIIRYAKTQSSYTKDIKQLTSTKT